MTSQITEGVAISVEVFFESSFSNTINNEFMFSYKITIENKNVFPIKLLRRHWYIFDSNATKREVEGDGVVGEQPIINPNQTYQYVSGCNLQSELGSMHGTYLFENLFNKKTFETIIPQFEMFVPFKLN
jgi:ApaG protein